jgi:hypothetical protein
VATQNNVSGRKHSVLATSLAATSPSIRAPGRIIAMACVLSTLVGCWSPSAEQQVAAVAKNLQELNPGFDGKVTPTIQNGVVRGLGFNTDNVTDISPVRVLVGLANLSCSGSSGHSSFSPGKVEVVSSGKLVDISPLKGMHLMFLDCDWSKVSDLSPLNEMPLTVLECGWTQVSDVSPLKGVPLWRLDCRSTPVSDLSPLQGMPLTQLFCSSTKVSDLSPLQGMNLTTIYFIPKNITRGMDVIRRMKSLKTIGTGGNTEFPADEFWKKYDAGDFNK